MASLHRLLWGNASGGGPLASWPIRPWETPAIGLPVRVATRLYRLAREAGRPDAWNASKGPTVWSIRDSNEDVLADGRRDQLGHNRGPMVGQQVGGSGRDIEVRQVEQWEVPAHPAFWVPFSACEPDVCDESYALYCDTLLFVTALDGGEGVLDSIVNRGGGILPFEDRWAWRARLHLPKEAWPCIESIIRWSERPSDSCEEDGRGLLKVLRHCMALAITSNEFGPERVDIQLSPGDQEIVRAVNLFKANNAPIPKQLALSPSSLCDNLCVRIAQVNRWATGLTTAEIVNQFPRWKPSRAREVMRQVATVFFSPNEGKEKPHGEVESQPPALVVLPEVAIPRSEVHTIRDLAAKTGCASLAGLYWGVLPPVYKGNEADRATRRWIVNEAELAIPIGYNDRGPTSVRWFRIRKPIPAHMEKGLVKALSLRDCGHTWQILEGRRWYRFVHATWGDFTVAVCADLLDPEPWRSLRGEVLHLFMVAFNRDVDLYEALTWTRTYETYANVIAVNHGAYGGSFLWTPRRRHGRTLARLRGAELFLIGDVELPVSELLDQQREGVRGAVQRAACGATTDYAGAGKYKAPPPGYRRRALVE